MNTGALLPHGGAWGDLELSDQVKALIPFALEIGFRAFRVVSLTSEVGVAPGILVNGPPVGAFCGEWAGDGPPACSTTRETIGAFLWLRPLAARYRVAPVLGVGFGRGWLRFARDLPARPSLDPNSAPPRATTVRAHQTLTGWDFLRARLGVDVGLGRGWSLGAYGALDRGQYDAARSDHYLLTSGEVAVRPHTLLGLAASARWVM